MTAARDRYLAASSVADARSIVATTERCACARTFSQNVSPTEGKEKCSPPMMPEAVSLPIQRRGGLWQPAERYTQFKSCGQRRLCNCSEKLFSPRLDHELAINPRSGIANR